MMRKKGVKITKYKERIKEKKSWEKMREGKK
jgi:hypothetical protein